MSKIEDLNTVESQDKFLWEVMQSILMWKHIIQKNFRAHHLIVAETMLYMLTEQVTKQSMDSLQRKIIGMEIELQEMEGIKAENKELRKKINNNCNKFKISKKK